MRIPVISVAISGALALPAGAAELTIGVEVPRLTVAEYHRPYVAIWYDGKQSEGKGATWLKDMRQWWRTSGRELTMPVDGITGATRAPGEHTLTFSLDTAPLTALPAGSYDLVVEAAREVGGRELLRIPFQWPPTAAAGARARGAHELGVVTLALEP